MFPYPEDFDWRIKLGGPEESAPLEMPGKICGNYSRGEKGRYPRMFVTSESADRLRDSEMPDEDYEKFLHTLEDIIDENSSGLVSREASFETTEDYRSQMLRYIRVGLQATSLCNSDRREEHFDPHNVDNSHEQLSVAQVADMWLQYTENGEQSLNTEEWTDREVKAFLAPEYAQHLLSTPEDSYDSNSFLFTYQDIMEDEFEEAVQGSVEFYADTLLPTRFQIEEYDTGKELFGNPIKEIVAGRGNAAVLELDQSPEEILDPDYEGVVTYSSRNIDTVEEHLGLAGMSEKLFEIGSHLREIKD